MKATWPPTGPFVLFWVFVGWKDKMISSLLAVSLVVPLHTHNKTVHNRQWMWPGRHTKTTWIHTGRTKLITRVESYVFNSFFTCLFIYLFLRHVYSSYQLYSKMYKQSSMCVIYFLIATVSTIKPFTSNCTFTIARWKSVYWPVFKMPWNMLPGLISWRWPPLMKNRAINK